MSLVVKGDSPGLFPPPCRLLPPPESGLNLLREEFPALPPLGCSNLQLSVWARKPVSNRVGESHCQGLITYYRIDNCLAENICRSPSSRLRLAQWGVRFRRRRMRESGKSWIMICARQACIICACGGLWSSSRNREVRCLKAGLICLDSDNFHTTSKDSFTEH